MSETLTHPPIDGQDDRSIIEDLEVMLQRPSAERTVDADSTPSATESSITTQQSRLGNLLRRFADKADRKAEQFNDSKETATNTLRTIGRSALNVLREAGNGVQFGAEVAVGTGVFVTESIAQRTKDAREAFSSAVESGITRGQELGGKAKDAVIDKIDSARDFKDSTVESAKDTIRELRAQISERADASRQRRQARRDARQARKEARQTKRQERIDSFKSHVSGAVETARDTAAVVVETAKDSRESLGREILIRRAVGAAALEAARQTAKSTRETLKNEQKIGQ